MFFGEDLQCACRLLTLWSWTCDAQLVLLDVVSQTLFFHALQSKRQAYDRQLQEAKEAEAAMVNSFKQVSICKMLKLCIVELTMLRVQIPGYLTTRVTAACVWTVVSCLFCILTWLVYTMLETPMVIIIYWPLYWLFRGTALSELSCKILMKYQCLETCL